MYGRGAKKLKFDVSYSKNSLNFLHCGACGHKNSKRDVLCDGCGQILGILPRCGTCEFPYAEEEKNFRLYCGFCGKDLKTAGKKLGAEFDASKAPKVNNKMKK